MRAALVHHDSTPVCERIYICEYVWTRWECGILFESQNNIACGSAKSESVGVSTGVSTDVNNVSRCTVTYVCERFFQRL